MEKYKHKYGAEQIQVLEGLEAVRKRPGMYIGSTSVRGLHHCVYEIVDNGVDEALAGYCTEINVVIEKDNVISVTDNGRGIPVEIHPKTHISTAETVYTVLHAGGKFGGDSGYKVSGGLHGVGASVVNALSTWTEVTIKRDGGLYQMYFEKGKTVRKLERIGDAEGTGTKVRFLADDTIFETQEFDGRIVEIYNMDDFDMLYNQNVPKGKFVLWTSENGKDYRLFIEKGFHNEVKELYTAQINKIWLDFWDQCDDVSKKFNFRILLPLCLVCIVLYIIISLINAIASFAIYLQIGILAIFIIGMIVLNRLTKNKIADLNKSSVALIKESLTEEGFENVLERQRTYIDGFFEAKQKEIDEELAKEDNAEKDENEVYVDDDVVNENVLDEPKNNDADETKEDESEE